jgi:hypothetical protein
VLPSSYFFKQSTAVKNKIPIILLGDESRGRPVGYKVNKCPRCG